jgi:hypothetical protein
LKTSFYESVHGVPLVDAKLLQGLRDARVGRYRSEVAADFVLLFANRLKQNEAPVDIDPG